MKQKTLFSTHGHVFVSPIIDTLIKHHAQTTSHEIYGWLLGTESKTHNLHIWFALPCINYIQQSAISALPDPKEFQEISSMLPHGVGIIGIYHSHPSQIFHSSTDNTTLQRYAKLYPKMVSAVTNRFSDKESIENKTKWYQFDTEAESVLQIEIQEKEFDSNRFYFSPIFFSWNLMLKTDHPLNSAHEIVPIISNYYKECIRDAEFYVYKGKLSNLAKSTQNFGLNQKSSFKNSDVLLFGKESDFSNFHQEKHFSFSQPSIRKLQKIQRKDKLCILKLPDFNDVEPIDTKVENYKINLFFPMFFLFDRDNLISAAEFHKQVDNFSNSEMMEHLSRSVIHSNNILDTPSELVMCEHFIYLDLFNIPLICGIFWINPSDDTSTIDSSITYSKIKNSQEKEKFESISKRLINIFSNLVDRLAIIQDKISFSHLKALQDILSDMQSH